MADDIRIKDLQSTASYMESDDYLGIDSLASGTRKINFAGLMDSEDDRLPTIDKTLRGAIGEHEDDISEIKQSLVNTRLICNSSGYFPLNSGDTPPYNRGQITVITRNRNTGAIYALWYDNSVTGFRVGAVISGSNPSQGNTVDIQYLG